MQWLPSFFGGRHPAGRPQGKLLVIRGGAIGDFILTLPVLAALRRQFPNTRLAVLGYPHIAARAEAGRLVDALRPIDSRPLAGFFDRTPGAARRTAPRAKAGSGFMAVVVARKPTARKARNPIGLPDGADGQCRQIRHHPQRACPRRK
jgi:hypothetical protein